MPLFSKEIEANGTKSDSHDYLTDELVPHYLKEKGSIALEGYLDGAMDMLWTITSLARAETSADIIKEKLDCFAEQQAKFVERTYSNSAVDKTNDLKNKVQL